MPTNAQRAKNAAVAVNAHVKAKGEQAGVLEETDAQDLVTDIMHLAQRQGWDPEELVQLARRNYHGDIFDEAHGVES